MSKSDSDELQKLCPQKATKEDEKLSLSFLISEIEQAIHKLRELLFTNHGKTKFPGTSLILRTFSEILIILRRIVEWGEWGQLLILDKTGWEGVKFRELTLVTQILRK